MRLNPNDFHATAEDPFQNDRLNREPQVNGLCNIIEAVEGHAVVSIEGSWGSGKTAFVKMCSAQLAQESVSVVDFNAWQESYTNTPLVDLVSAISVTLGSKGGLKSKLILTAWHFANVASKGLIDRDALESGESTTFDAWAEANEKVRTFQDELSKLVPSDKDDVPAKLVVIIDELDRSRPDYALQLIETVRHLFAVEGVVVLLAINREELCHSIQSLFGNDFGADRYLRRFVDVTFTLPPPSKEDLSNFTENLLADLSLASSFLMGRSREDYGSLMLQKVATAVRHNLRDLQQAIHLAAIAMESKLVRSEAIEVEATRQKMLALIMLRILDKAAYLNLAYGDGDAFAAVAAMNRAITTDHQSLADSDADLVHVRIETILLGEALHNLYYSTKHSRNEVEGSDSPSSQDTFKSKYVDAFANAFGETTVVRDSGKARADRVYAAIGELHPADAGRQIRQLIGIIDLIGFEPASSQV